jgi:integrase
MAGAKLERTRWPGIYRRGDRVVYEWTDADGKRRRATVRTIDQAREAKRHAEDRVDRERRRRDDGAPPASAGRVLLADFARAWIATYQGHGRGFRERTRLDYERDLERYVLPQLGDRRVAAVRKADVRAFVAWLVDDQAQADRHTAENEARVTAGKAPLRASGPLRDATVSRIVAVLKACMRAAVDDELRADNPASRVPLPRRDPLPDAGDETDLEAAVKALTREELATFLAIVHPAWRPLFRLLAATGLRISEALALDVRHFALDGGRPVVRVRRAVGVERRDGRLTLRMDRPKSEHGVRDVPIPAGLVGELRRHVAALPAPAAGVAREWGRLAFPSEAGTPMGQDNLRHRVLKPAAEEAGVAWAGFHAFRHAFASLHIERGTNIVRLSRLLGHHKASFTLDVYAHLLDDGYGEPLELDQELARGGQGVGRGSGHARRDTPNLAELLSADSAA